MLTTFVYGTLPGTTELVKLGNSHSRSKTSKQAESMEREEMRKQFYPAQRDGYLKFFKHLNKGKRAQK